MTQKTITGQAFRVLTDAANEEYHKISLWTHANDVETEEGNTLTDAMKDKYNLATVGSTTIRNIDEIPMNVVGTFYIDDDVGSIIIGAVTMYSGYPYTFFSYQASNTALKTVIVVHFASQKMTSTPLYVLRRATSGWQGREILSEYEGDQLRHHTDEQISLLDAKKFNVDAVRKTIESLDDIEMGYVGSVLVMTNSGIGYYDKTTNITTKILPGEYMTISYQNRNKHKFILMFSNTQQESELILGGGYLCTNAGTAGATWIITRILSGTDFSSDESGLREQIVTSLTGQLWPVGAVYINLTKQNPGDFLGGTWNLITEGILTAINGSVQQVGYHQRDLYKAVKDEDRGEHLYGVFVWQRIA